MSNPAFKLAVGGDVQASDGDYVYRPADDLKLYEACLNNEFSYVLACRQIGKSSLKNAVAERLLEKGIRVARIDLNRIGQNVSDAWDRYFSLLDQVANELGVTTDIDDRREQSPQRFTLTQRLLNFFDKVVLPEIPEPIVIFIDEIDMTNLVWPLQMTSLQQFVPSTMTAPKISIIDAWPSCFLALLPQMNLLIILVARLSILGGQFLCGISLGRVFTTSNRDRCDRHETR